MYYILYGLIEIMFVDTNWTTLIQMINTWYTNINDNLIHLGKRERGEKTKYKKGEK